MSKMILAPVLAGLLSATPVLAQDDMSCAAFLDLGTDAQEEALAGLESLIGIDAADRSSTAADMDADASPSNGSEEPSTGVIESNADDPRIVAQGVSVEDVLQVCQDNANITVLEAVEQAQQESDAENEEND